MSEARWVLEILGEDSRPIELPDSGTLVIGSAADRVGFHLEGQGVDATHCALGRTREGDWAVKDLGSRYGTLLNGQKVGSARLKLGDQLVLGSRRLELRAARAAGALPDVGSARPGDAPKKIAGYRLDRLIGKGGMGSVYLAVQESLRRPVALKVLSPKLAADQDFVLRFQAEARAAAALSHPNVVVVYDVGEENGAHYLSMEFMAGGSLEQKLAASGPLPWKTVLAVLGDAAAGLAYAESRGIVHRDIKPANLMFSGTGTVKIADLGLATTIEQEASEAVDGRKVFGTPHFIAPEQARGEAVDNRSDLYALGSTAYRLLSGMTPFEGATTRDILRALQNEEPRPLGELVVGVPPELTELIRRLMEKVPADRFPTAEALRRECERLRLVAEHGVTAEVKQGARWQTLVGLLLILIVGGASAAWYFLGRPGDAPPAIVPHVATRPALEPSEVQTQDDFFGNEDETDAGLPNDEALLRAREREAGQALRELSALLTPEQRVAELERIRTAYPGTAAAEAALRERSALLAEAAVADPAELMAAAAAQLVTELAVLATKGASLGDELGAIEAFRPPPEIGTEFESRRAALALERIRAAEERIQRAFERATQLALEGQFDALRAHLADLEAAFAEIDERPAEDERFQALLSLREEWMARRQRVDQEESFFLANLERAERRAVGEAIGPGSGLLAELQALNLSALETRMAALAPELRARPLSNLLAEKIRLTRQAIDSLQAQFDAEAWKRKSLIDPRSRKRCEVTQVRINGLTLEQGGSTEDFPWSAAESDPEWWDKLFLGRLDRDWDRNETAAVVALLRLVGATRGASLAREMVDLRGRGSLQPAELEALGTVFDPAARWAADAGEAVRAAIAEEQASAQRLASALADAQSRSWTRAATHIERLLAQREDSLLIALLSDGADWYVPPKAPPAPPPAEATPDGTTNGK